MAPDDTPPRPEPDRKTVRLDSTDLAPWPLAIASLKRLGNIVDGRSYTDALWLGLVTYARACLSEMAVQGADRAALVAELRAIIESLAHVAPG